MTSLATIQGEARQAVGRFGIALIEAVRRHRLYLMIIPFYAVSSLVLGLASGAPQLVSLNFSWTALVLSWVCLLGVVITLDRVRVLVARYSRGAETIFKIDETTLRPNTERMANVFVASILLPVFFSAFSSIKRLIPHIQPFAWDPLFSDIDRALHGGWHAWELLQPLLGHPLLSSIIGLIYNAWFVVLFFTVAWITYDNRNPALRMRFLLSFILTWIIVGSVMAIALSSAGPVFFGRMTGLSDPYQPLVSYLNAGHREFVNLAVMGHKFLWDTYRYGWTFTGTGISAMPSLHVAMAVLLAILGWRINRWAGIAYTVFAVLIQIGSVHLAWHYAIDGYVSVVAVLGIWWFCGKLVPDDRTG